ncbi:MAG: ATP-binding cassette domain-containing protein [Herminiimonas sp.]|nr:ATP-binding cassette domain-containing protein [Herminiimonas sp.]
MKAPVVRPSLRFSVRFSSPLGGWCAVAVVAAALVVLAPNTYWLYLIGLTATYVIVGTGLNVLVGLSGQVSIGHAGFFAFGAYVAAIATTRYGLSFWSALPLCLLLPAVLGALLAAPALRVRGPYLAMVTIAFGLVLQNVLIEAEPLTGGFNGISNIDKPAVGDVLLSLRAHAGVCVAFAGVTLMVFSLISGSRFGKRLRAVRDSETAARSIGIDPWRVKTAAFVVSAAAAGLAGGLFAPLAGFISPENFDMMLSIQFLLLVIMGGLGTRAGPLIGAIIVAALPEALSALAEYRLLFFGCLLLLILAVMPNGIAGALLALFARGKAARTVAPISDATLAAGAARATLWLARGQGTPLAARNIGITFGGLKAVADVSLTAAPGVVTGLIGPNGAGKTSVLNILGGFYRADAGQVSLGEQELPAGRSQACARAGVGRTFQTTLLFDSLSVADNVTLALAPGQPPEIVDDLLALTGFRGDANASAGSLAFVDRRAVEIARALALRPHALLLDEPAAGLAVSDKVALAMMLTRIASCGLTVLLVEHDMPLVMQACTALVAMENGRVLCSGSVATVRADPAVLAAYLGTGEALVRGPRMAPGELLLEVDALHAGYGPIGVLKDVSMTLRRHEMVAVVGANGAGKSTLMRTLTGLLPSSGAIRFAGTPASPSAERMARAGLVMVPEGRQVFAGLSVRDNLLLGGYVTSTAEREKNLALMLQRFPRLAERLHQPAALLSGGEQQMLAIARGLMARPTVLILDEPSLGLAPKVVRTVYDTMDELVTGGLTVLLVDQFAAMALAIADRGYLLAGGAVAGEGEADALRADPSIQHAYLGSST